MNLKRNYNERINVFRIIIKQAKNIYFSKIMESFCNNRRQL